MKTTPQKFSDRGLFKRYDDADEVLKECLLIEFNERRRPDLDAIIHDAILRFFSLSQFDEKTTSKL